MRDDLRVGIFDRREDAVGHLRAFEIHIGVDGGDDHVELRKHFVVQIERAVFQDVDFDSRQQADSGHALLRRANFFDLLERAFLVHAVGDGDGFRMVGQRDVFVAERARGLAHLFDGVLAVRGGRVHLQIAANVGERHELRAACPVRPLRFRPVISRSSGSM